MYVCKYECVCMYVWMHACMCVCVYIYYVCVLCMGSKRAPNWIMSCFVVCSQTRWWQPTGPSSRIRRTSDRSHTPSHRASCGTRWTWATVKWWESVSVWAPSAGGRGGCLVFPVCVFPYFPSFCWRMLCSNPLIDISTEPQPTSFSEGFRCLWTGSTLFQQFEEGNQFFSVLPNQIRKKKINVSLLIYVHHTDPLAFSGIWFGFARLELDEAIQIVVATLASIKELKLQQEEFVHSFIIHTLFP